MRGAAQTTKGWGSLEIVHCRDRAVLLLDLAACGWASDLEGDNAATQQTDHEYLLREIAHDVHRQKQYQALFISSHETEAS